MAEAKKKIAPEQLQQSVIIPLAKLEPNKGQIEGVPTNPRSIDVAKYKKLKASIEENPEMLSLREVLVYKHADKYVIIGGNMRYRALKELGYKDAICKVIPQEATAEQLRAVAIKDNNSFGDWDYEALANMWDKDEIDRWGIDLPPMEAEVQEDEAEEDNFNPAVVQGKPKSKEGDIFKLGKHRLICGDSTDPKVLQILMGDQKADMLLTDPPYNVDYQAKGKMKIANDNMEEGNFVAFLTDALQNASDVMKPGAAFYIWHADSQGFNFRLAVKNVGMEVRQCLIWNKNALVLGRQDYQWKHEPCLYGWKSGGSHYFINRRDFTTVLDDEQLDLNAMTKQELKDMLSKILELPTTVIDEDKPLRSAEHPTMKPLKLMGKLIKNSTRPGDIVLDLFGGSGSTMMAAEQLGRSCYMVELEPTYIDVICKRYEELTGERAEYLGNFKETEMEADSTTPSNRD